MRGGIVRRLYGPRRRQPDSLLLDSRFAGCGQERNDYRGPGCQQWPRGWTVAYPASRMDRGRSSAMRLLPDWTDHVGRGAAGEDSEPYRRADHQSHERQPVPLRNLRADSQSDSSCRGNSRTTTGNRDDRPGKEAREWRGAMSPLSRREFVAAGVAAGAGLVIGFYLPHRGSHAEVFSPNAYLRIAPDSKVTIVCARSEMGQGVRTALPMILAEELEADWKQIEIEQAGASTLFGDQTTGGSASIRTTWDPMRKAGAAAREMLISAAALNWGVPRSSCTAESGSIKHAATNRSFSYGELVSKAATLPIPTDVTLKQSKDYKIVGQRLPRVDSPAKVKGEAVFGIDYRLAGMKFAVLSRCPVVGGKVSSFDDKDSKKISGVNFVGKIGDAAVAVVADSVWGAMEGRRVLNVTWDDGPNKDLNTAAVRASLKQAASKKPVSLFSAGDAAKPSGHKISAEYELPFMAHAPMEPGNCTAHYQGTKCELWAPTQVPQDCRDSVATAIGLDPDQVKVNVTLMGGGFGRRLEHDYAVEAALVSKAISAPVKVTWTREDDMRFSTYRPASIHQLSAALDGAGFPAALTHRIIAPSISGQKGQPVPNGVDPDLPHEAGPVYGIPNYSIEYVMTEIPVPLGWMRSVYALQAAFALESFIDELAVTAGKD